MKKLLIVFFVSCYYFAMSQSISGIVTAAKSKTPIAYVNIGIAGKNIGTVSGEDGKFELTVPPEFENDTLLFSCIGYRSSVIKISDLRNLSPVDIVLREKIQDLKEIVIRPKVYKEKLLGISTDNKFMNAGFEKNQLGYEMGILMDVKKSAFLKKIDLNIATCSYDTIFYRINIYRAKSKMDFENVLDEPIYIKLPKDKVKDKITIDLKPYELVVDGDFLVTVELVKDLGEGSLYFCARLKDKTYYRKTSQAVWETAPVGISISVLADVEK